MAKSNIDIIAVVAASDSAFLLSVYIPVLSLISLLALSHPYLVPHYFFCRPYIAVHYCNISQDSHVQ